MLLIVQKRQRKNNHQYAIHQYAKVNNIYIYIYIYIWKNIIKKIIISEILGSE